MEGIVSKDVEAPHPERILVEDQVRAAGQVSDRRLCEDPAGVAALHVAKREGKDFVYVKSAPASIENHQWKSARNLMRS